MSRFAAFRSRVWSFLCSLQLIWTCRVVPALRRFGQDLGEGIRADHDALRSDIHNLSPDIMVGLELISRQILHLFRRRYFTGFVLVAWLAMFITAPTTATSAIAAANATLQLGLVITLVAGSLAAGLEYDQVEEMVQLPAVAEDEERYDHEIDLATDRRLTELCEEPVCSNCHYPNNRIDARWCHECNAALTMAHRNNGAAS